MLPPHTKTVRKSDIKTKVLKGFNRQLPSEDDFLFASVLICFNFFPFFSARYTNIVCFSILVLFHSIQNKEFAWKGIDF